MNTLSRHRLLLALVAATALTPVASARAGPPAPLGVLGLSASASAEVGQDLLSITLSTTREGSDANSIQAQLKQALDAALGEASYTIREVNVSSGDSGYAPQPMMRSAAKSLASSAPLSVEPGKATVTATVNRTVQMK